MSASQAERRGFDPHRPLQEKKDAYFTRLFLKDENTLAWIRTGEGPGPGAPKPPQPPQAPAAPQPPQVQQPAQPQVTQTPAQPQETQTVQTQTTGEQEIYKGQYIDDDGDVDKLTVKVSIAQNGTATFTLVKTEYDGDSDTDFYQGSVNGTNFTASEPGESTPDVIKGTITPKSIKGVYLDDGRKQEASFEATR